MVFVCLPQALDPEINEKAGSELKNGSNNAGFKDSQFNIVDKDVEKVTKMWRCHQAKYTLSTGVLQENDLSAHISILVLL